MATFHELSNGTTVKYFCPFEEREKLIEQAKEIAVQIEFPKLPTPKKGTELSSELKDLFIENYLYNPLVIEYRSLLRKIWAFVPSVYIVRSYKTCEHCEKEASAFYYYLYDYNFSDGTSYKNERSMTLCENCIKEQTNVFKTLRSNIRVFKA
jgi:hypothetical protein